MYSDKVLFSLEALCDGLKQQFQGLRILEAPLPETELIALTSTLTAASIAASKLQLQAMQSQQTPSEDPQRIILETQLSKTQKEILLRILYAAGFGEEKLPQFESTLRKLDGTIDFIIAPGYRLCLDLAGERRKRISIVNVLRDAKLYSEQFVTYAPWLLNTFLYTADCILGPTIAAEMKKAAEAEEARHDPV